MQKYNYYHTLVQVYHIFVILVITGKLKGFK